MFASSSFSLLIQPISLHKGKSDLEYAHTTCSSLKLVEITYKSCFSTGCSLNIVFFPRIFNILRPLPGKERAAIGCTENGQPGDCTLISHIR